MTKPQKLRPFVDLTLHRDIFGPPPALKAVETLNSHRRASSSVQILSDELLAAWRVVGGKNPGRAIDWWKSSEAMGTRLHEEIPVEEVADLFASLPPQEAVRRLDSSNHYLEEVAARRLSRSAVVCMWNEGFDDVDEDVPLWAWGQSNPLGTALRRHVSPDLLKATWLAGTSVLVEVAFMLWEPDHPIGTALRRHIDPRQLLPAWQQLAAGLPRYASALFDRAPKQVLEEVSPFDLTPLATSINVIARQGALKHLERMIARGLSEPDDPDAFIERWRQIVPINGEWAATLIFAAPSSVRDKLDENDLLLLLEHADRKVRLKAIEKLGEQRQCVVGH